MNKETTSVHAGQQRQQNLGVVNPIDPSTAFQYVDGGDQYYPRYFNTPNQSIICEKLCQLECAEAGLIFSSGMAAISTALMSLLKPGDHAVLLSGLYGGTHSFVIKEFEEAGIAYSFAGCDVDELMALTHDKTKLIFVESPTNPLLHIVDLRQLAKQAGARGILTLIDNTFASPINQNPIELGIDLVLHSGTKYLGGHSDLCFGAAVGNRSLIDRIQQKAIRFGGSINALTCYLIERSLKTLAVRVQKQNENATSIAQFLRHQSPVSRVFYPGLPDHPGHAIAASQMHDFGGMLSFEFAAPSARDFLRELKLVTPAMSLGGVETTATLPVFTSHRLMPMGQRDKLGITDRLVRLSVGIENAEDIMADLEQALAAVSAKSPSKISV